MYSGMHSRPAKKCFNCQTEMVYKGLFKNVLYPDGKKHFTCPDCQTAIAADQAQPEPIIEQAASERTVLDVLEEIGDELEKNCAGMTDEEFLARARGEKEAAPKTARRQTSNTLKNRFGETIGAFTINRNDEVTGVAAGSILAWAKRNIELVTSTHGNRQYIDAKALRRLVDNHYNFTGFIDDGDLADLLQRAENWKYRKVGQPGDIIRIGLPEDN